MSYPPRQGLYDPSFEHDACGVGFVADIHGRKSRAIVMSALDVLTNLRHRGASGSEANVGDGAGIQIQVPHGFLVKACHAIGIHLPGPGEYGVGMIFFPRDRAQRRRLMRGFERILGEQTLSLLGWRPVPTIRAGLGQTALDSEPEMVQVLVARGDRTPDAFERALYVARRRAERELKGNFYVASLSHRTLVYKGMLQAEQLGAYFPDLVHPATESAMGIVHSRFSTNTFPSWERAHPYRYVAHNGEINTLRGNVNWMHTREAMISAERSVWGDDLKLLLPIIDEAGSDSGKLDNVLEFLTLSGRPLAHAMMMMVPEPWEHHAQMSEARRDFYAFHSCLMEPWDGPAAIVFTDGEQLGACLDRNGLRPARYYVTQDDRVILASEVGVADLAPSRIKRKGRLKPGRMLLIDTVAGQILTGDDVVDAICNEHPYGEWLKQNQVTLRELPAAAAPPAEPTDLRRRQLAFGYTAEELRMIVVPMAQTGKEPVGSMGTDTPLAVLSDRPRPLFDYFKQLFAQVTNPPIDAIREAIVTSTRMSLGPEHDILDPSPQSCRVVNLEGPILTCEDLARIRQADLPGLQTCTLAILWDPDSGGDGLADALEDLFERADAAIDEGARVLILSDRGVTLRQAPIPALLATAGLHHYLIREKRRTHVGLVVETGDAREVHHFACLMGYGAGAINPYLALESALEFEGTSHSAYVRAATQGVLKVISKMGISTFQSYCGAEIFEAIGLSTAFVRRYFIGTATRIEGIGIDVVAEEVRRRHRQAFPQRQTAPCVLPSGGEYQYRHGGEFHLLRPRVVHLLQHACRTNDYPRFKAYSALVDEQNEQRCTLRSLFDLKSERPPVPLAEVEPIGGILARFKTGAMSYGSISPEAHEALAIAMNRIGGKSNSGEGGEDPERYVPLHNGDSRSSAIKQVASGRFGVTSHYLQNATEIQIKMAQGAKPGEGGQLPGHKVYPHIAKVRHSTPGVGLISPPPHHDIYSIEDLAQLIHDLKNANRRARISVKLVSTVGVGTIAAGVAKAHADTILISGYDGGTGAASLTSIKHAGVPWELGLAETHQTLLLNGLRSRVRIETDGQLRTGRDVLMAALLGAEEFGFATAPLVVLGCIMMRACHKNTCPVGIATQDPELRRRFGGDPSHITTFMRFIAQEVREYMAALGFRTLDELVGRADELCTPRKVDHWKAQHLDLSAILYRPEGMTQQTAVQTIQQDHGLDGALDHQLLLELCAPAIERGEPVRASLPVRNTNRVVGTMLGSAVTEKYGEAGLPTDTIRLHFEGSAGQSFGAFLPRGVTLILEGDANDYIGKGLSGGRIIVYPPRESRFKPEENILIGNVAFYGATSGRAFVRGMAGERFCVRNSGLIAVVEAIGDHGCEYMTGGRVVVLGPTGRNFAAGMSGGIAYVLDEDETFAERVNPALIDLEPLDDADEQEQVKTLIREHAVATGSDLARRVLAEWDALVSRFRKVMPKDYKRALIERGGQSDSGGKSKAGTRWAS